MASQFMQRLQRLATRLGFQRDWYLIALAAGIGSVTAFGAIGFVELVHWAELAANLLDQRIPWWASPSPP